MSEEPKVLNEKTPLRFREVPDGIELALAQAASGIGSGDRRNEALLRQLGNPIAFVTEKEWVRIKSAGDLPDEARFDVNIALRRYWDGYIDETLKEGLAKKLASAVKTSEQLLNILHDLDNDEDLAKKGATPDELEDLDAIADACESLATCCVVLEKASVRLYKGQGRKAYGPLLDLISDLDNILVKYTGTKVGLSTMRMRHGGHLSSDYVWEVCRIAHLSVAEATIKTRLGEYIATRDSKI